jgi:hypothetical protein
MPQWKPFYLNQITSECQKMASTWWTSKLCTNLSKAFQRCSMVGLQNIWAVSVESVQCKSFVDSGTIADALDANKRTKPRLMFLCESDKQPMHNTCTPYGSPWHPCCYLQWNLWCATPL